LHRLLEAGRAEVFAWSGSQLPSAGIRLSPHRRFCVTLRVRARFGVRGTLNTEEESHEIVYSDLSMIAGAASELRRPGLHAQASADLLRRGDPTSPILTPTARNMLPRCRPHQIAGGRPLALAEPPAGAKHHRVRWRSPQRAVVQV